MARRCGSVRTRAGGLARAMPGWCRGPGSTLDLPFEPNPVPRGRGCALGSDTA
ncbi:MAG: hypothetical protein ACTSQ7_09480 [Alphaproteobacteria bacterium]